MEADAFGNASISTVEILRETPFDIFGYSAERKTERQWREDYQSLMQDISGRLSTQNYEIAVMLAELPEHIRGFGPVREV